MKDPIYFYRSPHEMFYIAFQDRGIDTDVIQFILGLSQQSEENDAFQTLVDEMCHLKALSVRYQIDLEFSEKPEESKLPDWIRNTIQRIKKIIVQNNGSVQIAEYLQQFVIDAAIDQVVPYVQYMNH